MFFYGESDTGLVRRENQDSFVFSEINEDYFLAAVLDGMGGLSSGSIASSLAKEKLAQYLSDGLKQLKNDHPSDHEMQNLISDAVAFASHEVYMCSLKSPEHKSMGTTLAAILKSPRKTYIFHVGDSRVYALASGRLHRLTTDHTFVQYLIDTKQITPSDAETHPQKHVLTKAIGTEDFASPDISVMSSSKAKCFLLCSDGLTLHLSDSEIEGILSEDLPPREKVGRFIKIAKERGAYDNITVLIVANT